MTIVGFDTDSTGTRYAVADSVPGKITWYTAENLLPNLNLLSIFAEAIPGVLPLRGRTSILRTAPGVNVDSRDNVDFPPR